MRRSIVVFLLLISLLLFGCRNDDNVHNVSTQNPPNDSGNGGLLEEPMVDVTITVRSLTELEHMRTMITCKDEDLVSEYLSSFGGVKSIKELAFFLNLVDTLPYGELHQGKISFISYSKGITEDTQEPYEILYITVKATDGEWIRYEYLLSAADVGKEIEERTNELSASNIFIKPAISSDQKIKIYAETREQHPSEPGTIITWTADINSVFVNIVYYSLCEEQVEITRVLSEVKLSSVTNN